MSTASLLEIRELDIVIQKENGRLNAIQGLNLEIYPGEIVALVGESGCGKTLTALSILRLLENPIQISGGQILFEGANILDFSPSDLNRFRGHKAAMIFQEPMTALNPVFTIGAQIIEVLTTHAGLNKKEGRARAVELLADVGIPHPEKRVDAYPFELSGGMRQRAMIAMALAGSPSLLIADEPTTALDVTIQAQILALIKKLSADKKMSVLLITHDLGTVSQVADRMAIMYAGKIVEYGPTGEVLKKRKHPYTQGLLNSLPSQAFAANNAAAAAATKGGKGGKRGKKKRLEPIPGTVPTLEAIPSGCAFRTRCAFTEERCRLPVELKVNKGSGYRCIL